MEEKQSQQKINYVEMTGICNECRDKDSCDIACKNGVCKLIPKP